MCNTIEKKYKCVNIILINNNLLHTGEIPYNFECFTFLEALFFSIYVCTLAYLQKQNIKFGPKDETQ